MSFCLMVLVNLVQSMLNFSVWNGSPYQYLQRLLVLTCNCLEDHPICTLLVQGLVDSQSLQKCFCFKFVAA